MREDEEGNLLELAVKAAGLRASLGEISDACEVVVGRYKAIIRTISGVYSSETKKDADLTANSNKLPFFVFTHSVISAKAF